MKSFLVTALLTLTQIAHADGVYSVTRSSDGEPHLVKFNSGAVEFVEANDLKKLKEFESQIQTPDEEKSLHFLDEENYEPTQVSDAQIKTIFKNLNPYMRRKSECSDRAHVWAWDEFNRNGTKSEKAFLMLTDTYIKRNRYKWWFHVAPMFTTTSEQKIVMDFQFFDRPITFNEWKNSLVFSKRECVRDFRFLDYNAGADQSQDCYVKFEPMYYYIPGDIGIRENGSPRTSWNVSQVNSSRSRAFFKGSAQ